MTHLLRARLTWVWLLAGRKGSRRLQRLHSTILRRLGTEPLRVLATSLFWLDDRKWWPYIPVFAGIVAPAERWLRWWRWLFVGLAAIPLAPDREQLAYPAL